MSVSLATEFLEQIVQIPDEFRGWENEQDVFARIRPVRKMRLLLQVRNMLGQADCQPMRLPLLQVEHLLERASLEEDEGGIDRWCHLLANACTDAEAAALLPACTDLLSQLTFREWAILQLLWDAYYEPGRPEWTESQLSTTCHEVMGMSTTLSALLLENLIRLRLLLAEGLPMPSRMVQIGPLGLHLVARASMFPA